jgi:hypothetical protein
MQVAVAVVCKIVEHLEAVGQELVEMVLEHQPQQVLVLLTLVLAAAGQVTQGLMLHLAQVVQVLS